LADVERSEKELDHAQRKIKQQDEIVKKLKLENESLKQAKKALSDDLQKLLARRQDIENL
jgi:arginine repressor